MTEQQIKDALSGINEPVLNRDFNSLNFIKGISLNGDILNLTLGISDTGYGGLETLKSNITQSLQKHNASLKVNVKFTAGVIEHNDRNKNAILPGVKNTIAVASGKGGVGKSTVTVNLAAALAGEGAKVGIIDADIYGPSIPLMMGIKGRPSVMKTGDKNKLVPMERHGIKVMSIGFLMDEGSAVVWRGPMASSALKQFIGDVVWGELDYLLFDMPPGTGDIQLTLSQTLPLTGAVIVTTPQEISLADARKGYKMFEKVNVPTLGIIENMSYYTTPDGSKDYIFGQGGGRKMSDEFSVKLLGEIPIDTAIRKAGDAGTPIVTAQPDNPQAKAFTGIARTLIKEINIKNLVSSESGSLEIII
jgi:ATP-binding protein involved in chromosome partitioning